MLLALPIAAAKFLTRLPLLLPPSRSLAHHAHVADVLRARMLRSLRYPMQHFTAAPDVPSSCVRTLPTPQDLCSQPPSRAGECADAAEIIRLTYALVTSGAELPKPPPSWS